jgi:hypothetical protein
VLNPAFELEGGRRGSLGQRGWAVDRTAIWTADQQLARGDPAGDEGQRCQRGDEHDRQLLGEIRSVGDDRAENDARLRRDRAEAVAGGGLAIFGEVRLQQVALGFGFALERPQLHVLVVGGGGLALELVEIAAEAVDAGAGDARVVLERVHQPLRRAAFRTRGVAPSRDVAFSLRSRIVCWADGPFNA